MIQAKRLLKFWFVSYA